MDGIEVVAGTLSSRPLSPTGNGRIVLGKGYTDRDDNYSSVQVDELIFFNSLLKPEEIDMLVEEAWKKVMYLYLVIKWLARRTLLDHCKIVQSLSHQFVFCKYN